MSIKSILILISLALNVNQYSNYRIYSNSLMIFSHCFSIFPICITSLRHLSAVLRARMLDISFVPFLAERLTSTGCSHVRGSRKWVADASAKD